MWCLTIVSACLPNYGKICFVWSVILRRIQNLFNTVNVIKSKIMKIKQSLILSIFCLQLLILLFSTPQAAKAQQTQVSFQIFYDNLSPYGTWLNYPGYGYVWIPAVEKGFSPYSTAGHWVWTDEGWLWVSNYEWGWAPFHYGRWYFDDGYGWMWIPGEEWAPAWVSWRSCPGYYGWAPLYPGISVSVAIGESYYVRRESWVFVQSEHIGDPNLSHYYGPRSSNESLINRSTPINRSSPTRTGRSRYIPGPDRGEVEHITGKPVQAVALHEIGRPGQSYSGNAVNLFRPAVSHQNTGTHPAPAHVSTLKDFHTSRTQAQATTNQPHTGLPNNRNSPSGNTNQSRQPLHTQAALPPIYPHEPVHPQNSVPMHRSIHAPAEPPQHQALHPIQPPPPSMHEPIRQETPQRPPEMNVRSPQQAPPMQHQPRGPHS
jgi:hypothetical protein